MRYDEVCHMYINLLTSIKCICKKTFLDIQKQGENKIKNTSKGGKNYQGITINLTKKNELTTEIPLKMLQLF